MLRFTRRWPRWFPTFALCLLGVAPSLASPTHDELRAAFDFDTKSPEELFERLYQRPYPEDQISFSEKVEILWEKNENFLKFSLVLYRAGKISRQDLGWTFQYTPDALVKTVKEQVLQESDPEVWSIFLGNLRQYGRDRTKIALTQKEAEELLEIFCKNGKAEDGPALRELLIYSLGSPSPSPQILAKQKALIRKIEGLDEKLAHESLSALFESDFYPHLGSLPIYSEILREYFLTLTASESIMDLQFFALKDSIAGKVEPSEDHVLSWTKAKDLRERFKKFGEPLRADYSKLFNSPDETTNKGAAALALALLGTSSLKEVLPKIFLTHCDGIHGIRGYETSSPSPLNNDFLDHHGFELAYFVLTQKPISTVIHPSSEELGALENSTENDCALFLLSFFDPPRARKVAAREFKAARSTFRYDLQDVESDSAECLLSPASANVISELFKNTPVKNSALNTLFGKPSRKKQGQIHYDLGCGRWLKFNPVFLGRGPLQKPGWFLVENGYL